MKMINYQAIISLLVYKSRRCKFIYFHNLNIINSVLFIWRWESHNSLYDNQNSAYSNFKTCEY